MATLQSYLQNGGTLDSLQQDYSLKICRHNKYNNLILFKYNQIRSPFKEKIVQESRGIILDENDNWNIISYPYNKFFNYNESLAVSIDWNTAKVYEKLDGSLMTLYYYENQWHISTSGKPDASGSTKSEIVFAELFWNIWNDLNYSLPDDTTKCYIFEMMSPITQIIVPQTKNNIVLHGVRCLQTLQEYTPDIYAEKYGWKLVDTHNINSFEELITISKTLNPIQSEGFVVCDYKFNRCKIKGILYIKLAHIGIDNPKDWNLLSIIVSNEYEEVLSAFPHWKDDYYRIKKYYDIALNEIENTLKECKQIKDRKTIGLKLKNIWYSHCIFGLVFKSPKFKYDSIQDWISSIDPKKLYNNIKPFEENN